MPCDIAMPRVPSSNFGTYVELKVSPLEPNGHDLNEQLINVPFSVIFRACNEVKVNLDQCFREEKQRMLAEMNKDLDERRREEEAQAAISTGKNITFREYLAKDKDYQKDIENIRKSKQSSWFG